MFYFVYVYAIYAPYTRGNFILHGNLKGLYYIMTIFHYFIITIITLVIDGQN